MTEKQNKQGNKSLGWWTFRKVNRELVSTNWKERYDAVNKLAASNDSRALALLVVALRDEEARVRSRAAIALGNMAKQESVDPLLLALNDEVTYVRESAVNALGQIGDLRALEAILACLEDLDVGVRIAAEKSLVQLGRKHPVVEGHLVKALLSHGWRRSYTFANILKDLSWRPKTAKEISLFAIGMHKFDELLASGDTDAADYLLEILCTTGASTWEDSELEKVIEALGMIRDARAVPPLIAKLGVQSLAVRSMWALAKIGDSRAVEPLVQLLLDNNRMYNERATAAYALGQINDVRAAPSLVQALLKDKAHEVNDAAADALEKLGSKAFDSVVGSIQSEAAGTWWPDKRLRILENIGDNRAIPLLVQVFRASGADKYSRGKLAKTLDSLDWEPADPEEYALYALALGKCPAKMTAETKVSEKPLVQGLLGNPTERKAAVQMLIKMDWHPANTTEQAAYAVADGMYEEAVGLGTVAIGPLLNVLRTDDCVPGVNVESAIEWLGKIGDRSCIEELICACGSVRAQESNYRKLTVPALKNLLDREVHTLDLEFLRHLATLRDVKWEREHWDEIMADFSGVRRIASEEIKRRSGAE